MPIPTTKARNFEELLESNLREMGMDAAPINSYNDNNSSRHNEGKKEFLRRKSKKPVIQPPPVTKKYNYYVDNFDE